MKFSIYIREDDVDLWRALPKKAEAIHNMLHSKGGRPKIKPTRRKVVEPIDICPTHGTKIIKCKKFHTKEELWQMLRPTKKKN